MKRSHCLSLLVGLVCLSPTSAQSAESTVTVKEVDKHVLEFSVGKDVVARYNFNPDLPKPYFFPVTAPGGLKVTRGVPPIKGDSADHPHQTSAWFCHGDIIPEGIEVKQKIKNVKGADFWSINPGHGMMVCTKVQLNGGKSPVETFNEWRTADGVKLLDEKRLIQLVPSEGGYLFILDIDLHASVCPITFGDTKEGSMGLRVPDSMTESRGKGMMTNAEGKTRMKAIWGGQSDWCDYSGPVTKDEGAAVAGIAIFDHPSNKPRACWHARDYGLMAANPFGRKVAGFPAVKGETKLVRLEKGEHLRLRYGMFIHKGDVKEGKVAEAFAGFAKMK